MHCAASAGPINSHDFVVSEIIVSRPLTSCTWHIRNKACFFREDLTADSIVDVRNPMSWPYQVKTGHSCSKGDLAS